jgi:hypothetical protein
MSDNKRKLPWGDNERLKRNGEIREKNERKEAK